MTGDESGSGDRACAQLMWGLIVRVRGSDAHIRAMWVREADDQPAAWICCSCLICSSAARRGSLIDPDIQ